MLLAIDQGTTGTTCLVLDESLQTLGRGYQELRQHFPRPGWWSTTPRRSGRRWSTPPRPRWPTPAWAPASSMRSGSRTSARRRSSGTGGAVRRSQRAIVWQDRRTAARCAELPVELIRERTGLVPDPYFSATKLEWLLANAGAAGDLAFGTIDSWLLWKLCGEHVTDVSNASRTMLLDITALAWDDELLDLFSVPRVCAAAPRPLERRRRRGRAAGRALPSLGSPATSRRRCSGSACFTPGRPRRRTAPAPSCS